MKSSIAALPFAVALAVAPATKAQDDVLRNSAGGWSVDARTGGHGEVCRMVGHFEDDTFIELEYRISSATLMVMFRNLNWRALQRGDYSGLLTFFGTDEPALSVGLFGGQGDLGPVLSTQIPADEAIGLLRPMSQATSMRVQAGEIVVGTYSMAGSQAGIQRFAGCMQNYLDRLNSDPFRRQSGPGQR